MKVSVFSGWAEHQHLRSLSWERPAAYQETRVSHVDSSWLERLTAKILTSSIWSQHLRKLVSESRCVCEAICRAWRWTRSAELGCRSMYGDCVLVELFPKNVSACNQTAGTTLFSSWLFKSIPTTHHSGSRYLIWRPISVLFGEVNDMLGWATWVEVVERRTMIWFVTGTMLRTCLQHPRAVATLILWNISLTTPTQWVRSRWFIRRKIQKDLSLKMFFLWKDVIR